jgi:hypothetical protein
MKAKQLTERDPRFLVEQDPCLGWPEPEFVRQLSAKLSGQQQDNCQ